MLLETLKAFGSIPDWQNLSCEIQPLFASNRHSLDFGPMLPSNGADIYAMSAAAVMPFAAAIKPEVQPRFLC